jgi:hypothetical protein
MVLEDGLLGLVCLQKSKQCTDHRRDNLANRCGPFIVWHVCTLYVSEILTNFYVVVS